MKFFRIALGTVTTLFMVGCAPTTTLPPVTIMTFNVENLFDNVDDPGKDDKDFLPIVDKNTAAHRAACARVEVESWRNRCLTIDWSDTIVEAKLAAVAATILQVNEGRGPDVLALQEIENIGILERLRNDYLGKAGYLPGILVEGADSRGIDAAFLTRLPLAGEPVLHPVEVPGEMRSREGDTRGILQADFRLPDGSLLTGFSVHFPAPYHPGAMRVAAYETLNALLAALPADRAAFAAGDFNTTSREDKASAMLENYARPDWIVSNDLCEGCRGTAYYGADDSWSFLDMILFRPGCCESATWTIRADSVRIANATARQVRDDGTPRRFAPHDGSGVSDHWPVVLSLEPTQKQDVVRGL